SHPGAIVRPADRIYPSLDALAAQASCPCTRCFSAARPWRAFALKAPRSPKVDLRLEVRAGVGMRERLLELDALLAIEGVQRRIEALYAALAARDDRLLDRDHIALLDELGDVRRVEHHLDRRATLAVLAHHQALGQDRAQILGEIEEYLIVLVERKEIDDSIERLRAVVGVQSREHEMPRAREVDRRLHALAVADLTDQNHIGSRTHHAAQRPGVGFRIEPDLALVDDRALVRMQELDRILDRHDVVRGALVAVIDHRRDRGGLARAGRADQEDEPAFEHDELAQRLRKSQILEPRHVGADVPQNDRGVPALQEHVDAEAPESGLGDREIDLEL